MEHEFFINVRGQTFALQGEEATDLQIGYMQRELEDLRDAADQERRRGPISGTFVHHAETYHYRQLNKEEQREHYKSVYVPHQSYLVGHHSNCLMNTGGEWADRHAKSLNREAESALEYTDERIKNCEMGYDDRPIINNANRIANAVMSALCDRGIGDTFSNFPEEAQEAWLDVISLIVEKGTQTATQASYEELASPIEKNQTLTLYANFWKAYRELESAGMIDSTDEKTQEYAAELVDRLKGNVSLSDAIVELSEFAHRRTFERAQESEAAGVKEARQYVQIAERWANDTGVSKEEACHQVAFNAYQLAHQHLPPVPVLRQYSEAYDSELADRIRDRTARAAKEMFWK